LAVTSAEIEQWRAAVAAVALPYDDAKQIHQQDKGFTDHEVWDFEATARAGGYPLLLHAPYFDIYRKQVVKQADLILAMHWRGDVFTPDEKARAFAYYEPLTVRDSSLSAATQAVLAAEVGHLDLAYDYLVEASLMDLQDLEHNTRDGLHMASLAGSWLALVAGFGGMRDHHGQLSFKPQLPPQLTGLSFALRWRASTITIEITVDEVTYQLRHSPASEPVTVWHWDEPVELREGAPVTRPVQLVKPLTECPQQPAGCAPGRRV
jgi:alpha,alpha-trehalose phosphorylase